MMRQDERQMDDADRRLTALLDEALAPEAPRADLAERVFLASRAGLRRRSVLARIGHRNGLAAAAAVLLAVGVGVWSAGGIPEVVPGAVPGAGGLAEAGPGAAPEAVPGGPGAPVEIHAGVHLLAAFDEQDTAVIDQQIGLLALQIELAQSDSLWPRGDEDPLIEAALESQLDRLSSEAQWVF